MSERLALDSPAGRWTVAAAVLGSGAVFLESTVVNVALPAIGHDFGLGIEGLQWVLNGYLLTLSALILLGGSLGDVYGGRVIFAIGLIGFAATSVLTALAPDVRLLVASRALQGAAGALLVPNSLAILDTAFVEEDRGAAIGRWAAWSAVSTALGPLLGGWLVDALSWRWVFACAVPFALAAAWIAMTKMGEAARADLPSSPAAAASSSAAAPARAPKRSVDYAGASLVTLGLGGVVAALTSGAEAGFTSPLILFMGLGGVGLLVVFFVLESRTRQPLLPLSLFDSSQFTGANITTVLVYAALGGLFFLLILQLQNVLGYSALEAGAALLPVNALMLAISPLAGRIGQRIGPRWPMSLGALVAGVGMVMFTGVEPGAGYVDTILPALVVFGVGLASLVAPLTAAVLGAVPDDQVGIASGVNNAAARLAGLLATAVLPLAAGLGGLENLAGPAFAEGYTRAMWISAGLCLAGAVVAFVTVRSAAEVNPVPHPSPEQGCTHRRPCAPPR